ncbi:hypothetical protein PGT21_023841 [Puccinia graminis f. sp. tritici]|uniref:Uncharacterized protein n=1 Tax=Puccinia graminis f. sp. tritici TaxID=56615 RepID=A0A5B0MJM5_PUCGR|nr:hypothetical protein PGT21_023841 [Puccinia graminis f. sp. tritici]KAA1078887.1 hypothetical protein PGTUg99_016112 [Puccinia graminis f. sp. tritici]
MNHHHQHRLSYPFTTNNNNNTATTTTTTNSKTTTTTTTKTKTKTKTNETGPNKMTTPATAALNQIMNSHQLQNTTSTTTTNSPSPSPSSSSPPLTTHPTAHHSLEFNRLTPSNKLTPDTSHQQQQNRNGHRKGRYSLSVFSSLSSPLLTNTNPTTTTNNHHKLTNQTTTTSQNISTPTLVIDGPNGSGGYASLGPSTPDPNRRSTQQSLLPPGPPPFLARYLTPSSPASASSTPAALSPVAGPSSSARPDWALTSSPVNNNLLLPHRSLPSHLARSHSLVPPDPLNSSALRFSSSSSSASSNITTPTTTTTTTSNSNNPLQLSSSSRGNSRLPADNRAQSSLAQSSSHKDRSSNNNSNSNGCNSNGNGNGNPNGNPSGPGPGGGGGGTTQATSQLEAKVVILGMQGVGKTSIVHRYTTGSFSYSLTSTIGASFCTKKLSVDGCKVRLQIWDTAGQERFRSMAPMYYRGANAAILVYDITNQESFLDIQNWLDELRQNMSGDLIIQIVGSKADLAPESRAVEMEAAHARVAAWTAAGARPDDGHLLLSPFGPAGPSNPPTLDDPSSLASSSSAPSPSSLLLSAAASSSNSGNSGSGWNHVGISEVSAKDDFGIEELFLVLSRRLVLRKTQIEALRSPHSRDSIRVHHHHHHQQQQQYQQDQGWKNLNSAVGLDQHQFGATGSNHPGSCC